MSIKIAVSRLTINLRFYILTASFLVAVFVAALLRITIDSDRLYVIRLEQLYGLLGVLYWFLALLISPLAHIFGKSRMSQLIFSRRGIGVSAFMFSVLHASVAFFGQLGGIEGLKYYPSAYIVSLVAGLVALLVLTILALTSFDRLVRFMTYRWWKWLHRIIYIGGVLAVLHVWLIGTHLDSQLVRTLASVGLLLLSGLEVYRAVDSVNTKRRLFSTSEAYVVSGVLWAIIAVLILSLPTIFDPIRSAANLGVHVISGRAA